MTSDCMRSNLEPEQRLMAQESTHYEEVRHGLVRVKSGVKNDEEEEALSAESQEEEQLKKPRRKDTPVLHCPPHVPGGRLLMAGKQMVHVEDEEKDGND